MDSQVVEIMGRNELINRLLKDGLEVAVPARDRGIDLIAYLEKGEDVDQFTSFPIQMKAASQRSFSINEKYTKVNNLILVFVWSLDESDETEVYALTYDQSRELAEEMGWANTETWKKKGIYTDNNVSDRLQNKLKRYKMVEGSWRELLLKINKSG